MAARQVGVFFVVLLGLYVQVTLLRHELSLGHRWHADTLIFSQVGSVLLGALSFRWIQSRDLGAVLSGFIVLCRVLQAVRDSALTDAPGLTVSAGLATLDEGETSEQVVKLADERLYAAKRAGRDRVVFSS